MFKNAKVGDKVEDYRLGEGEISANKGIEYDYPIGVNFPNEYPTYTYDGKYADTDLHPSLFPAGTEIPRPVVRVKKEEGMTIQEALKETGKASYITDSGVYNYVSSHNGRPDGKLRWYNSKDECTESEILIPDLLSNNWQPYHPKEEILPKREDCIHDTVCKFDDGMCSLECGHFMEEGRKTMEG